MLPAKIRFSSLTAALFVALLAMSAGHSSHFFPQADAQEPAKPEGKGAKLKQLLQERLVTARDLLKEVTAKVKNNSGTIDELFEPTRLAHEASLELCESAKERIQVLEKFLAAAKDNERIATNFAKSGQGHGTVVLKAKAERLRVEIAVERAKAKSAAKPIEGNAAHNRRGDQAALAENQAAIKRAAVKVVEAQKAKAQASLATIKAHVAHAKAAESFAELQFQRFKRLFDAKSIEEGLLNEQRAKLEAAKAHGETVQAQIAEAESQVAIEQARVVHAELEFAEADLRMKQLKARHGLGQ